MPDEMASAQETAVLEQMGLLASTLGHEVVDVPRPAFAAIVISLHGLGHHVSPSQMAWLMGVSKGTVSSLIGGHAQPGIDLLLRLATAYGVELPSLLLQREGETDWLMRSTRHGLVVWTARRKPRIDWESAQQKLDIHMSAEAALPVAQVAKELQVDARHLAACQPKTTAALTERYRTRVARERSARRAPPT
ncbi:hypothetical protein ASD35_11760 [Pelomonas sp. Root1444]|nr:hypothetical protein ASD35_11760 [Pelomonas sp. Root1444]